MVRCVGKLLVFYYVLGVCVRVLGVCVNKCVCVWGNYLGVFLQLLLLNST